MSSPGPQTAPPPTGPRHAGTWVFAVALALTGTLVANSERHRLEHERTRVEHIAGTHAGAIQRNIERALSATYPLAALVRQQGGRIADFDTLAERLLPFYEGASALALAPDGVVREIVPRAGNERAIGHDLLRDPARDKEAFRARDTGTLTLAGPFDLVQGGRAAAGRLPVFLGAANERGRFWGFVSVLIRFPQALQSADLDRLAANGYAYELWRIHPDSGERQLIAASGEPPASPVDLEVVVPNGKWHLSVAPAGGWRDDGLLARKIAIALLVSALLGFSARLLARERLQRQTLEIRVDAATREIRLRETELQSAQAVAHVGSWTASFGPQPVVRWSPEMFSITGIPPTAPQTVERFLACVHPDDRDAVNAAGELARQGKPYDIEHRIVRPDGEVRWVQGRAEVVTRAGDTGRTLVGTLQDITARKQLEATLDGERIRLTNILDGTDAGTWEWNVQTGATVFNERWASIVGYTLAELAPVSIETWQRLAHPDDLALSNQLLASHFSGDLPHYDCVCRMRHRAGHWVWIRDRGKVKERTADGQPLWMYGTHVDVSDLKRAEASLRESEERFRRLFEDIEQISVQGYDREHRVIFWNRASEALYGFSRDEAIGRRLEDLIIPDAMRSAVSQAIDGWIGGGPHIPAGELVLRHRDGRAVPVFSSHTMQINARGEPEMYCVDIDLRARHEAEARMREALVVFNTSSQGIMTTNTAGEITAINPAFSAITGYAPEEVIGHRSSIFRSGRHDESFYDAMWAALTATGHWDGEIWNKRKSGEIYPQWLSISTVRDSEGRVAEYVAMFSDITERKEHEEAIWRQANFDALTGLANRSLLGDRLERALTRARRHGKKIGLVFLDLDGFKWINDTLGHDVGDELLVEVARRLKGCIREQDTAARLGGDEFTVVIHDLGDAEDMLPIAEKIVGVLREAFTLDGRQHALSGSVGITVFPDDGEDVQTLLKNADIAMYKAKQAGKNRFQFYARHMQVDAQARMQLEADLREAIATQAFMLHYQPVVDADSGELLGAEALIRWQHPERGVVSPLDFVPVAEDCGLIVPIGAWVLREAARQWRTWRDAGHPPLRLAVNVSGVQFREPDFSGLISGLLEEFRIEPGCLVLEITESVLMDGSAEAEQRMREIKESGVGYALDDFGTGFSSLSYLKRFPVDVVKIDRSFVNDCPDDRNDAHLVEAIINMAHSLDLRVTAEGVETDAQLEFLRDLGCDNLQGYLIGRPLPAAAFTVLIERRQLLLPNDGAGIEESRFLAELRRDEIDIDDWLRRLLGERSPELAAYRAEQDWVTRGLDLRQAIRSHLEWRRGLHAAIESGNPATAAVRLESAGHPDQCLLGKWIREQVIDATPEFERLDEVHRTFHQIAGQIAADFASGHRSAARRALSAIRFRTASRDVVVALIDCYRHDFLRRQTEAGNTGP